LKPSFETPREGYSTAALTAKTAERREGVTPGHLPSRTVPAPPGGVWSSSG